MSMSTTNTNGSSYGGGKSGLQQPKQPSGMPPQQPGSNNGPISSLVNPLLNQMVNGAVKIAVPGQPGSPPQLDLSGFFNSGQLNMPMPPQPGADGKTPEQKVLESQRGGGILKLRGQQNPGYFPPPEMPNQPLPGGPIFGNPGYGGGKGIFQPMNKPLFQPMNKPLFQPINFNQSAPLNNSPYTTYQNLQNTVPTDKNPY